MKRLLFLFSFLCIIALMGVMANGGAAYPAETEPVLIQQSLDQTGEVVTAGFVVIVQDVPHEVAKPEISLTGSTSIGRARQESFVNYSPGIAVRQKTAERFLS
jgi:predicted RNA-binding protein with TRAM domain